ncbi:MOSC domain-containing protein [Actinoplanes sp. NPDC051513]|uniref:MOSC domain-containing protein n=1 Tax=Actinoplanes sp. NPDC051513 TaxID=3363908 RepID=UPI0037B4FD27
MEAEQGTIAAVSCNDTYAFTKPVRDEIVLIAGVGVKGDVHAGVHVKHRGRVRNDPTQPNFRQVHLIQHELFAEVGAKGFAVAAGNLGENVTTTGVDLLALPVGTILRFGPPAAATAGTGGVAVAAGTDAARAGTDAREAPEVAATGLAGRDRPSEAGAVGREGPSAAEALKAVLEVAAAAELDRATAASAVAVAAAAARDRGDDPRAAVVLAGLRNPCAQINVFRQGLLKEVIGRGDGGDVVYKAGVMAVVLRGGPIRPGDAIIAELPPLPHAPLERV